MGVVKVTDMVSTYYKVRRFHHANFNDSLNALSLMHLAESVLIMSSFFRVNRRHLNNFHYSQESRFFEFSDNSLAHVQVFYTVRMIRFRRNTFVYS